MTNLKYKKINFYKIKMTETDQKTHENKEIDENTNVIDSDEYNEMITKMLTTKDFKQLLDYLFDSTESDTGTTTDSNTDSISANSNSSNKSKSDDNTTDSTTSSKSTVDSIENKEISVNPIEDKIKEDFDKIYNISSDSTKTNAFLLHFHDQSREFIRLRQCMDKLFVKYNLVIDIRALRKLVLDRFFENIISIFEEHYCKIDKKSDNKRVPTIVEVGDFCEKYALYVCNYRDFSCTKAALFNRMYTNYL